MFRTYEICGDNDNIFTQDTQIINNGQIIRISFVERVSGKLNSTTMNCDDDET